MMDENALVEACRTLVPLGPWLELCEEAEVPFVPAEFSPPFPVRQILMALDGDATPELDAAFAWLDQEIDAHLAGVPAGKRFSARWECCSSEQAKHAAAHGKPWGEHFYRLLLDDCRVEECTIGETTRVCIRPWIETMRYESYPVEFRFFLGPHQPRGVSSYYPQRPLSEHLHLGYAKKVLALGTELARTMTPQSPSALAQAGYEVGFSADFIVRENGEVIFLEGGPPHIAVPPHPYCPSAHPCCMKPGVVVGVALAPREGALLA